MARRPSVVEIDFLGLGPSPAAQTDHQLLGEHLSPVMIPHHGGGAGRRNNSGSSIRDITKAVSRIDPGVLRSIITAPPEAPQHLRPAANHVHADGNNDVVCSNSDKQKHWMGAQINSPLASPRSPISSACDTPAAPPASHQLPTPPTPPPQQHNLAPMTIFYDGAVSVFHVTEQLAELVIKTAKNASSLAPEPTAPSSSLAEKLISDTTLTGLPLARKKSLQRFLQKRQQRLTFRAPYTTIPTSAASSSTLASGDGDTASAAKGFSSGYNKWAASDVQFKEHNSSSDISCGADGSMWSNVTVAW